MEEEFTWARGGLFEAGGANIHTVETIMSWVGGGQRGGVTTKI